MTGTAHVAGPAHVADPAVICPLCSESVDDLLLALVHPDTESPAHFDCVLREIRAGERLEPGEQVCYVGGGVFGIVARAGRRRRGVRIRKRIPYEPERGSPPWRNEQVRRLGQPAAGPSTGRRRGV